MPDDVVFLFDVDNTLLDNDRVQQDLSAHLEGTFGRARREEYWEIFEALRAELGYSDYLGALQRYRLRTESDPRLLLILPSSSTIPSRSAFILARWTPCAISARSAQR